MPDDRLGKLIDARVHRPAAVAEAAAARRRPSSLLGEHGKLMMIVHRPFNRALGKLYEMRDDGDRLSVVREAVELDLEAYPTHPCTGARC